MVHRTLIVIVATVLGVQGPGLARAGESPAELVQQVTAHRTAERFAEAARLADDSARREDLDDATRVLLGGLARQNYELSFGAGGAPTELCKAAAIMRHVAPLDTPEGRPSKLAAAEEAEGRLALALGPTWHATCTPVPIVADAAASDPATDDGATSEPSDPASNTGPRAPAPEAPPPPPRPDRRRVRAGVGTLVSGLALFAPMSGLLVYRAAGERDLTALDRETMDRPRTKEDDATAAALGQRYTATTAGAIVLGVTGAALVVTSAVLLGSGKRNRRMAAAPWGAWGAGGLVLEGRF